MKIICKIAFRSRASRGKNCKIAEGPAELHEAGKIKQNPSFHLPPIVLLRGFCLWGIIGGM